MSDVLDNERGPMPVWVVPLAILAVLGVVAILARSGGDTGAAPAATPSASASPTPAPLPSPVVAGNACGGHVEQPLLDTVPLPAGTGLRLLVGDRDLRLVDVDAGTAKVVAPPRRDKRSFTQLVQAASQPLAILRNPCSADGYGKGLVAGVDAGTGRITVLGAGDDVLPGEPPTVLDFDAAGTMTVRAVGSSTSTPVPPRWLLQARTANGFFATVAGADNAPPELGIGSPERAALTTSFGRGYVVAASPELLFWLAGDCPGVHCLLTWTTVEGTNTAQAIDTNAWGGVVSPDGSKMAFRKQRASGQLGEHPGPPDDIAIVGPLGSGEPIRLLPGLVLPAKAGLTLAWSPDSEWLVIGVDLGTGPGILLWREGMEQPAQVPLPPTGGGTTGPPALLVLPR